MARAEKKTGIIRRETSEERWREGEVCRSKEKTKKIHYPKTNIEEPNNKDSKPPSPHSPHIT